MFCWPKVQMLVYFLLSKKYAQTKIRKLSHKILIISNLFFILYDSYYASIERKGFKKNPSANDVIFFCVISKDITEKAGLF